MRRPDNGQHSINHCFSTFFKKRVAIDTKFRYGRHSDAARIGNG